MTKGRPRPKNVDIAPDASRDRPTEDGMPRPTKRLSEKCLPTKSLTKNETAGPPPAAHPPEGSVSPFREGAPGDRATRNILTKTPSLRPAPREPV
eukprot:CAMPEP_0172530934 /NCGR_PEP_ID=MMETSP1067-20121228/4529_1 /TAXON_ID=265564 ORGANISM="Thalassiosira punctigera, Strain Tpunct2005C2" /NCGR_SAMPLE_ID=MMETSP1067 /ASSEMBLY_ACC=CAM_ASM_000444 /LENGTH=94 /DNA_ID=CAMNT_0013315245 /DNA_START=147 /DNA_END=428 /DNA_ORIENTATION=+